MNRLPIELDRLYGIGTLADRERHSRVAVLEVLLPAGWDALATVWRGVQSDLELPAPAIAVSGSDGLQLWFSFASPVPPTTGARFLQALRGRYLEGLPAARVRVAADADSLPPVPFREVAAQRWSAFITHDLAAVFDDTPWLDIPPTDEGQATILRALAPMRPGAFEAALVALGAVDDVGAVAVQVVPVAAPAPGPDAPAAGPAGFLTAVMNDDSAPLALRIEAAAILLRHGGSR